MVSTLQLCTLLIVSIMVVSSFRTTLAMSNTTSADSGSLTSSTTGNKNGTVGVATATTGKGSTGEGSSSSSTGFATTGVVTTGAPNNTNSTSTSTSASSSASASTAATVASVTASATVSGSTSSSSTTGTSTVKPTPTPTLAPGQTPSPTPLPPATVTATATMQMAMTGDPNAVNLTQVNQNFEQILNATNVITGSKRSVPLQVVRGAASSFSLLIIATKTVLKSDYDKNNSSLAALTSPIALAATVNAAVHNSSSPLGQTFSGYTVANITAKATVEVNTPTYAPTPAPTNAPGTTPAPTKAPTPTPKPVHSAASPMMSVPYFTLVAAVAGSVALLM